jgi:threonine dehydrogenase-like Zn-dependent dehydrogenase
MKAVVFHDVGDIRLDDVPEPSIQDPTDALIQITASAICGTDLHFVRGTIPGMQAGTILGHEAVGVVGEIGEDVHNLQPGDRVLIPSTIACGYCSYCRSGYYAQCDHVNANGPQAGTAFFGGPKSSGPIDGLQAEMARVPFAHVGAVRIPENVSDEQAILVSDIFPTGYFAAEMAEIKPGNTVAVFGSGPVGQFAILSAWLMDAGRILAIDRIPSRLETAAALGAETVNFDECDPVERLRELTGGIGPDRVIDAVGIDAESAHRGPGRASRAKRKQFAEEVEQVAPDAHPHGKNWVPGNAPSQVLEWAIDSVAKAGTLSIVGVYSEQLQSFPIGKAMGKNLAVNMGNCHHRKYIPRLLRLIASGQVDPTKVLTKQEDLISAIEAYESFDRRETGWLKVELVPALQFA